MEKKLNIAIALLAGLLLCTFFMVISANVMVTPDAVGFGIGGKQYVWLGQNVDGIYVGDIKFGEGLPANSGTDIGDVTLNNTDDIPVTLDGEVVSVDATGQGDVPITLDGETVGVSANVAPAGKAGSASYVNEPAANTAAQVVLAAPGAGVSHIVGMVVWSYDSLPDVGSNLIVEDDTGNLFKIDIDESGPGFIPWNPGLKAAANDAVTVTLSAGGTGINGIVNVFTWTE